MLARSGWDTPTLTGPCDTAKLHGRSTALRRSNPWLAPFVNTLSYRCRCENGLSFELLVDGQPLHELFGGEDGGIPYWDVEDDLAYYPPHGERRVADARIVCVCSCGEYGCGHTRCRVEWHGDVVVWRGFDCDVSEAGRSIVLEFSRENYDAVVSGIVGDARSRKAKQA